MAYHLLSGFSSGIDFSRTDADPGALLELWAQHDIGLISDDCFARACGVHLNLGMILFNDVKLGMN
jgi:hypothetical protein